MVSYFAPYYLMYADSPERSDAVMILDGPDYIKSRNEAVFLYKNGYAKYIFIPGQSIILAKTLDGIVTYTGDDVDRIKTLLRNINLYSKKHLKKEQSSLEQTHFELIMAKLIMNKMDLSSAVFVSNPYHMRRIKTIADEVFEGLDFKLYFVPTRYSIINKLWWLHKKDINWITSEYMKIMWFWIYSHVPFLSHS